MASPGGSMTQELQGLQLSNSSTGDVTMSCKLENAKSLTMRELQEITDNFSLEREIGRGSYGKVYKGALDNGEEIAVKLLHNMLEPNDRQFQQEFENLMRLEHPNIVRFVGYCYETQHKPMEFAGETVFAEEISKALCFEYMPNGSLGKHLSEECDGLDWHRRYRIIKGTCEGLKYLHEGFKEPMYHLDLKPDNILLDDNMDPKLADFGLSRLFGGQQTMSTQSLFGTIGYMPPEYLFGHVVSKKLDIFSLGVVMTKIIAGPSGHTRTAEMPRQEFLDQVQGNWRSRLQATCSPSLLKAHSEQVNICTEIALSCMEMDRHKRPSIVDIIHQLNDSEVVIDVALSASASLHSWIREDLVKLKAFTRSEAIPGGETCNEFPVLVRVTAPAWCDTPHTGVDVVAVLDFRSDGYANADDMIWTAINIVINKLGRHDRLAIVLTKGNARLTELIYMSDHGREVSRLKLRSPEGKEDGYIVASLLEGAKILRERKMGKSRVGCIMFLTSSQRLSFQEHTFQFPVHTFGLGYAFGQPTYQPRILKDIADMCSGTFNFFNVEACIPADSFMEEPLELFITCLRKVAATSIKITLVAHEGVTISSIESGGYKHRVSSDKQSGQISMDNIYAGEQKNFIVYLTVAESTEKLLTVGGRFQTRNDASKQLADMEVFVLRPRSACSPEKLSMHREVAAELTRTQLVKGISAMMESQESDWKINLPRDDFEVLWETVRSSEEAHSAPEKTLLDLGKDIAEMTKFTAKYPYSSWRQCGMDYVLSWLSSHEWQRATTKGFFYETGAFTLAQYSVSGQHANHAEVNDG